MTRKITVAMLDKAKACKPQRDIFQVLYIENLQFTEKLCREFSHVFDFLWAANNLLTAEAHCVLREHYEEILIKYKREPIELIGVDYLLAFARRIEADGERRLAMSADYASAFYHAWVSKENEIGEPLYTLRRKWIEELMSAPGSP